MLAEIRSSISQPFVKILILILLKVWLLDLQPGSRLDDLLIPCACEHMICCAQAAQVVLRWQA